MYDMVLNQFLEESRHCVQIQLSSRDDLLKIGMSKQ
jgi:hypothetical protein